MNGKQIFPFLTTRSLLPENQESPVHFLKKRHTPVEYFYRRNHFPYPLLTAEWNYWLQVSGHVYQPRFLHYNEILSMPAKSLIVPLECAGNKRSFFDPKVYGEQWEDGAMSQGKWTGVPLKDLLEKVGISRNSKEIVFEGADFGKKPGIQENIPFVRSLPLEKALHPDTIIAYHYNDQPLSFEHGYPLRLIVPNWYAMASVKWLSKIEAIDHSFQGPFQTDDYVYYPHKDTDKDQTPVTILHVNSTIQQPTNLSILNTGTHKIKGIAWTGKGIITNIQLSFDKGETWVDAILKPMPDQKYAWVSWSYSWKVEQKGEYSIYSRAKDSSGRIQPLSPIWNRKGYGYNAVSKVTVKVE